MGSTEAGRLLAYLHWTHEDLAKAMVQAEDDIRDLRKGLRAVEDERDQYYEESRRSAKQLGGVIRALQDDDLPDDVPALREAASRPRRFTRERVVPLVMRHRYFGSNGINDLCACGAQWLIQAERCVTQSVGL